MENEENQDVTPEESNENPADAGQPEETNWKAEALKYKAIADRQAKKAEKVETPKAEEPTPPVEPNKAFEDMQQRVNTLTVAEDKRQFGHSNKLSPEETDFVFASAPGLGMDPAQAMENPFVKSAIESMRAQRRAEENIPDTSTRAVASDGRTFEELKNDDERRAHFDKVREKHGFKS